jgi:hypothetical protein
MPRLDHDDPQAEQGEADGREREVEILEHLRRLPRGPYMMARRAARSQPDRSPTNACSASGSAILRAECDEEGHRE